MTSVLIVEDEPKMLRLLELNLGEEGWTTFPAGDAETGLKILGREAIDLVLSDFKLPGMNGLEFLDAIHRVNAEVPVVLMTAYGSVETAVEAMKKGASDYVLKPFSLEEIKLVVRKERDAHRLRVENRTLREELGRRSEEHTSELQSLTNLVCRLLLEKKKIKTQGGGTIINITSIPAIS